MKIISLLFIILLFICFYANSIMFSSIFKRDDIDNGFNVGKECLEEKLSSEYSNEYYVYYG